MATQSDWRFCVQCTVLYFDGHSDGNKGDCPGAPGGQRGHRPAGYNFVLPRDIAPTPNAQNNWRNCWKCQAMYFDGHSDGNKGRCPSGGQHDGHGNDPATFNFVLPFNIAATRTSQAEWRNCWKCQAMFFDGRPDKGRCAAGGGHEGHAHEGAFNFVLPHPVNPRLHILTPDGTHVRIIGEGYTPGGAVKGQVLYRVSSTASATIRDLEATADVVTGRFEVAFNMTSSGGWWEISSAMNDLITGAKAEDRIGG